MTDKQFKKLEGKIDLLYRELKLSESARESLARFIEIQREIIEQSREAITQMEGTLEAAEDLSKHLDIKPKHIDIPEEAEGNEYEVPTFIRRNLKYDDSPPVQEPEGYTEDQVRAIVGDRFDDFISWMSGQTIGVRSDGTAVFYYEDVKRFANGLPVID